MDRPGKLVKTDEVVKYYEDHVDCERGIIYCNKIKDCDVLVKALINNGIKAAPIHSIVKDIEKNKKDFKEGRVRGINLKTIPL